MDRRELSGSIGGKVWELADRAIEIVESDPDQGFRLAEEAWRTIPEPRTQWLGVGNALAGPIARQALTTGRHGDAAIWLERYREVADAGDRHAQSTYWALAGELAYATGVLDSAVDALDRVVELTGYYESLGGKPDLIAFHREQKGLLPIELRPVPAPGGTPPPDHPSADDAARLDSIRDEARALDDAGDSAAALRVWERARAVTPAPHRDWAASVYAGIGESLYQLGDAPTAELAFRYALASPGGPRAAVLARLAQCAEARDDEMAAEKLWAEAERLRPGITDRAIQES